MGRWSVIARPMGRWSVIALLALTGCAWEDGRGFARLSGLLWAHMPGLQPESDRLDPDGWFKANNSFELKLSTLQLALRRVDILAEDALAAASADCHFDPADPPAGCSLCHSGHCHCDEVLKSFEELEREFCGGGAAGEAIAWATLELDARQDLLGPGTRSVLSHCSPSCELGRARLDRVQLVLDHLLLTATLRDESIEDRLQGQTPQVTLDWDLRGAPLTRRLTPPRSLDRDSPYQLKLEIELALTDTLLDDVRWHELERAQQSIRIDALHNPSAGETLLSNLARTELAVSVAGED